MAELLFVIIIANIALLLGCFRDRVGRRAAVIWLVVSVVVIGVCAAWIIPKTGYDLTRHYEGLEKIRESGMGIRQYIFRGAGSLVDSNYRAMFTFNAICYVIAKFLPPQTLPLLSILFCYGIFGYILHDFQKQVQMPNLYVAASILLSNVLMPFLYVYSNVRNEMAVAIMALAVYLRIYKKKHLVIFLVLTLLAATMHPITLVAVPFVFLSRVRPGIPGLILVGVIPMALYPLMEVFRASKVDFLKYIGAKFYNYTFVHVYYQGRFFFIASIVEMLIVLVLALFRVRDSHPYDRRFVNFVSWYSIFSLANFQSYQIAMRLPYLLAMLTPVLIYTLFRPAEFKGQKAYLPQAALAGTLGLSGLALIQNYLWFA